MVTSVLRLSLGGVVVGLGRAVAMPAYVAP